jgi:hypothetical protein
MFTGYFALIQENWLWPVKICIGNSHANLRAKSLINKSDSVEGNIPDLPANSKMPGCIFKASSL